AFALTTSPHRFTVRRNKQPTGRPVTSTADPSANFRGCCVPGGLMSTRSLTLAVLALLLIAVPLAAQIDKATVDAVALDQTGSPLPGVTVVITRPATGFTKTAVTDSAGIARFNSLA